MKRYAVIGASHGTGLAVTRRLEALGSRVRAISRTPPAASELVEPVAADVTDAASLKRALAGEFDAVFFTVDINGGIGNHALFGSRSRIRAVTHGGCLNAIAAVEAAAVPPKFVLLSVMGVDRTSLVWTMLNIVKPGSKRNILEREQALRASRLPYVILRAPRLTDDPGGSAAIVATPPEHPLESRSIARADLARVLVAAALHAPDRSVWDVFPGTEGGAGWLAADPSH